MQRYFRYESAGDQFTGRVVAGLPVNSSDFSILPSHFPDEENTKLSQIVKLVFPQLWNISHLQAVLRLVLASLVFHHDFLVASLPQHHALLQTVLFCNPQMLKYLQSILVSSHDSKILRATGIPPHVEVYKRLDKNHDAIESIPSLVLKGMKKLLDDAGTTAGYISREILEQTISSALASILSTVNAIPDVNDRANDNNSDRSGALPVYHWGKSFHLLPQGFEIPSCDLASAWRLWWLGNPAQSIMPFSKIKLMDLTTQTMKNRLSEWRYLLEKL